MKMVPENWLSDVQTRANEIRCALANGIRSNRTIEIFAHKADILMDKINEIANTDVAPMLREDAALQGRTHMTPTHEQARQLMVSQVRTIIDKHIGGFGEQVSDRMYDAIMEALDMQASLGAPSINQDAAIKLSAELLKTVSDLRGSHVPVAPQFMADLMSEAAETIRALASLGAESPNVEAMVNRFLGWRLPQGFAPDHFINFDRESAQKMHDRTNGTSWPIGTNLLNADEAREMFKHVTAALPAPAQEAAGVCAWSKDGDDTSDTWATSCGKYFCLNEGSPKENSMKFCHSCGKPLEEHPYVYEPIDDKPAASSGKGAGE